MDLSVGCSKKSNEPKKKEKAAENKQEKSSERERGEERERKREKRRGEDGAVRAHTKATRSNQDLCVRCPHPLLLPLAAATTNSSFINRFNIYTYADRKKEKK